MLRESIYAKDFEKAKAIINSSNDLFGQMQDYQMVGIFDKVIREKAFDVLDALIEKKAVELDIYLYDSFKNTIFTSLIQNLGNDDVSIGYLKSFIPRIENLNDELDGLSLLSLALENVVDVKILEVLIDNGCNINFMNDSDENLIHRIIQVYYNVYNKTYVKGLEYLNFFFDQGLEIDKPNVIKKTPLHFAVIKHHMPYIKWLLDHGADPNVQDWKGISPFYYTLESINLKTYQVMREYANPEFHQRTNKGESMLFEAICHGCPPELLKLLLEDGADLFDVVTNNGKETTLIDILVNQSSGLLEVAINSNDFDVNRQDNKGNTLLHKICSQQITNEHQEAKKVYRNVKYLLNAGADPNMTNAEEKTPLMLASNDNLKSKTVELILRYTQIK